MIGYVEIDGIRHEIGDRGENAIFIGDFRSTRLVTCLSDPNGRVLIYDCDSKTDYIKKATEAKVENIRTRLGYNHKNIVILLNYRDSIESDNFVRIILDSNLNYKGIINLVLVAAREEEVYGLEGLFQKKYEKISIP